MVRVTPILAVVMLIAPPVQAQGSRDCRYEADRTANVDGRGLELLRLRAGSGSLRVEGQPGLQDVRVRGHACASSEGLLDRLQVTARRSGTEAVVQTLPEEGFNLHSGEYARIDLTVEVPAGLAADVVDGSGSAELSGLGRLTMDDGSGSLQIHDVAGAQVEDGSGSLELRRITGDVTIDDGSGEIELHDVRGSVTISDGSGSITASGVTKGVHVRDDGSGSIHVADVGGDFIVDHDGSGGISYHDVRGRVDIPERHRRRR